MRVTAFPSVDVIEKAKKQTKQEGVPSSSESLPSSSSPELVALVTAQLSRAMEQTTATLRSFTLEKHGRAKIIGTGCCFTALPIDSSFSALICPEIHDGWVSGISLQSYARIGTQLCTCYSEAFTLEPFRSQLNQKQANLSYLNALITREDELAKSSGADIDMRYTTMSLRHLMPLGRSGIHGRY